MRPVKRRKKTKKVKKGDLKNNKVSLLHWGFTRHETGYNLTYWVYNWYTVPERNGDLRTGYDEPEKSRGGFRWVRLDGVFGWSQTH